MVWMNQHLKIHQWWTLMTQALWVGQLRCQWPMGSDIFSVWHKVHFVCTDILFDVYSMRSPEQVKSDLDMLECTEYSSAIYSFSVLIRELWLLCSILRSSLQVILLWPYYISIFITKIIRFCICRSGSQVMHIFSQYPTIISFYYIYESCSSVWDTTAPT